MTPTVAIVGTLDTKGDEVAHLKELVEQENCSAIVMDVGILHAPVVSADIAREQVVLRGGIDLQGLLDSKDRRLAVETMIRGASEIVKELHKEGRLSGIIAVGGGTGTHIGTGIMRALPL